LAAKTRVSLVFSQPAIAPDAGKGLTLLFLHPELAASATMAIATAASIHFPERIITIGALF